MKIENEVVEYGSRLVAIFSNVDRGPTPSFHGVGTQVDFFKDPIEFMNTVMAHEIGHCVNLGHCDAGQNSIMQESAPGGASLNHAVGDRGYYDTFKGNEECTLFNSIQIKL